MDILAIISSYLPTLSKSEKIAQYILSNSDEVVNLSINELALLSEVRKYDRSFYTKKLVSGVFKIFKRN